VTQISTPPPAKTSPILELDRSLVFDRLFNTTALPTPPGVAMQIVQQTSRSDVTVAEIGELLRQDPAICAQVLKAINSCLYSLSEPITSIERAVLLLGLNTIRSIVLALSLPAMQFNALPDKVFRYFWQSSVSGAVIARELSIRMKKPSAEDDLLCGLLRDLGLLLLHQAFPTEMLNYTCGMSTRPFSSISEYEIETFGMSHADVSAELLRRWNLPEAFILPIQHHHEPERMPTDRPELVERCERLGFVDALTNLDIVAHHPGEVEAIIRHAEKKYGLNQNELVGFLQDIVPKVEAFTALFSIDIGYCQDFAATLSSGCQELMKLTMESGRVSTSASVRTPVPAPDTANSVQPKPASSNTTMISVVPMALPLPDFEFAFVENFPASGCYLDGFELTRLLGRGAMGCVFQAWDPALDRKLAIKMMSPDEAADVQYQLRFIREARSAAAIQHDNVVGVYTVKELGILSYLCMEYVEGRSLEDLIDSDGPLSIPALRDLAIQMASGLSAAHAKKVIHRDIKPANIIIESQSGRAKLTDFGLARAEKDQRLTLDGGLIGTPLYMSPEQASGNGLDHRSDLFSLGAVLYTAATGKLAFDGPSMFEVLKRVCESEPVPPSTLRAELPEWFDKLVQKLLAKHADNRFASADELLACLVDVERKTEKARGGWRRLFGIG
jgi:eukaryotic-like serine/threonine-protein kinase